MKPEARSQKPEAGNPSGLQPSAFSLQPSQRGVALVITLILLSVTLLMAVAFLAISRRERGAVATQADAATARLAADTALSSAEAQIAANINGSSPPNPYSFGLLVSTNYLVPPLVPANPAGDLTNLFFSPRAPVFVITNQQTGAGEGRLYLDLNRNGRDDPNGVMVATNAAGLPILDVNKNPVIVTNVGDPDWVGILEFPDQPYGPNNPVIARFAFLALPVGNSLDLNAIHNQVFDEKNANPTVNPPPALAQDGYFRNQGAGSWELNLAGFLADLNTNQWGLTFNGVFPNAKYYYYQMPPRGNVGFAFDDARALLTYRYNNNYLSLAPADNLLLNAAVAYPFNLDGYSDGPLQTTLDTNLAFFADNTALPWAGADNTNHFYTPGDLFDPAKTEIGARLPGFTDRLLNAGAGLSTYDRYTFYRMLPQLGTDTTPDAGKMDLNYDNLDPYATVVGGRFVTNAPSATNLLAWTPIGFFTNAADRLLKAYTAQWSTIYTTTNLGVVISGLNTNYVATFNVTNTFGVTGIPVWVSNRFVYTPAVNRLLQLAANMYDATTTNFYPSRFRPLFQTDGTNVFIAGYEQQTNLMTQSDEVSAATADFELIPPVEVTSLLGSPTNTLIRTNVYGVPWIIGAKKGFPNFEQLSTESDVSVTRKLQVTRDLTAATQPDITGTNQMLIFNLTNYLGLACWNSYRSNYYGAGTVTPGKVDIVVRLYSTTVLTNDNNMPNYNFTKNFSFAVTTPLWPAWKNNFGTIQPGSFIYPLNTNLNSLANGIYFYNEPNPPNGALFAYEAGNPTNYLDKGIRQMPHFGLLTTNRLQIIIIDYSDGVNNGRIIDYVQLNGLDSSRDLNSEIQANDVDHMWDTNYDKDGNLLGVYNQVNVSKVGTTIYGVAPQGPGAWSTTPIPGFSAAMAGTPAAQQAFFRAFFASDSSYLAGYTNYDTSMQAPYTPTINVVQDVTWQANDPLVHYLSGDLNTVANGAGLGATVLWPPNSLPHIGNGVPDRYQPWGNPGKNGAATGMDPNPSNLAFKDPLVYESANWDFPTNYFPTVGWLGRVHRGTPWQTVYLKASGINTNTWAPWTGDTLTSGQNFFDAANSEPVSDRPLFDLFTTALNDNATRGTLSVNVGSGSSDPNAGIAAWSAAFSGVVALTNNASDLNLRFLKPSPPPCSTITLQPAGFYNATVPLASQPPLVQIVQGINSTRNNFNNPDKLSGVFEHAGDILSVPQLTEKSPFLNRGSGTQLTNGISDEIYEWLPQQAMGLLRVGTPRYVIYSYGQALKPAPNGIYQVTGPLFGMVTNYQVVSETATRAVVRFTPTNAVLENFNVLPPD